MERLSITEEIKECYTRKRAKATAENLVRRYRLIPDEKRFAVELYLASVIYYLRQFCDEESWSADALVKLLRAGERDEPDMNPPLKFLMDECWHNEKEEGRREVCVEWYRLADTAGTMIPFMCVDVVKNSMTEDELASLGEEAGPRVRETKLILDPVYIKRTMDAKIVGQDAAKVSVAMAIFNHYLSYKNGVDCTCETTMLIGPTGCGKTMIAQEAAQIVGLPCVVVDSSQISEDGWKGLNKDKVVKMLYDRTTNKLEASYGVIILDEFDKLCRPRYSSGGDDVGKGVQAALLGLMDGIPVKSDSGEEYETKNILFILTGAYSEIPDLIKQDKLKSIGFGVDDGKKKDAEVSLNDYRNYMIRLGMMPEMSGRIANIVSVEKLTPEQVYEAITNGESAMSKYQKMLEKQGKRIEAEPAYLRKLCRIGYEQGLGVRGTRNLLSEKLREAVYQAFVNDEKVIRLGSPKKSTGRGRKRDV